MQAAQNKRRSLTMQKTLKAGCAEAVFDTLGGELISYKNEGKEYVWTGEKDWNGHAPVLFPFVSALKNKQVAFEGVTHTLPTKHGFARKSEFALVKAEGSEAAFELVPNEDIKAQYPYDFKLTNSYSIDEAGYTTTFTVENTGDKDMQFCLGGHPGFMTEGSAEDYELVFEKEENCDLYYTDADSLFSETYKIAKRIEGNTFSICYGDYDVDALIAKGLNSRKVKLVKKSDGKGMEFDFNGFQVLVLWTPPKKQSPFLCLEPWIGLPAYTDETGNFEDKPYRIVLHAGQRYSASYRVNVIK